MDKLKNGVKVVSFDKLFIHQVSTKSYQALRYNKIKQSNLFANIMKTVFFKSKKRSFFLNEHF